MKYDKYLIERRPAPSEDEEMRLIFKNMDATTFGGLKDAYYSIADNTTNFLTYLELAAKKNPELKKELAIAKKAVDTFKKLTIGRYL